MENLRYKLLTFVLLLSSMSSYAQTKKLIKTFKFGAVGYNLYSQNSKPNPTASDTTFYLLYRIGNNKVLGKEIFQIKEKSTGKILTTVPYKITKSGIVFTKDDYENRRYLQNSKGKLSFDQYDNARTVEESAGTVATQIAPPPTSGAVKSAYGNSNNPDAVDIIPEYTGGINNARKFVASNVAYPAKAQENNVEGTMILTFVIEKDGNVTEIVIDKGLGFGLDEEVISVMKRMPKWSPAKLNGQAVRYKMRMPITFKLSD